MRIDVHTHAFHSKIVKKAMQQLLDHYKHPVLCEGTKEDLLKKMELAKIDKAFVHSAATTPEQVIPANNWAIELTKESKLIPFGTIHPDYTEWENELSRLKKAGIKGLKIHPDFQGFPLDSKKMFPVYETISGKFVVMFHVGDVFPPDKNPSSPQKLATVLKNFPNLIVIAAHFGGFSHWQWVKESLSGFKFFMDTSSTLRFIQDNLMNEILDAFPEDYFLFGSDYPMGEPGMELKLLKQKAGFSEDKIERLLARGIDVLSLVK